jgi:hypothetical protein
MSLSLIEHLELNTVAEWLPFLYRVWDILRYVQTWIAENYYFGLYPSCEFIKTVVVQKLVLFLSSEEESVKENLQISSLSKTTLKPWV